MMNRLHNSLRLIVGLVLAATSTAAIVLALLGLAVNPVIWWFTLVAGIAFQLALYLLALGSRGDRWLSRLYLTVSVAATVAFFEYAWQHQAQNNATKYNVAQHETFAMQQLQRQIKDVATQIATLQRTINQDTLTWRQLKSIGTLQQLEQRRETLLQRYETLQQTVPVVAIPTSSLEAALHAAPTPLRIALFLLLAFLLDIGAIRLLRRPQSATLQPALHAETQSSETLQNVATHSETHRATQVETNETPETIRTVTDETSFLNKTDDSHVATTACNVSETLCNVIDLQRNVAGNVAGNVATLAETIKAGKYGEQPIVRQIIYNEGVRHSIVKQAFDLLIEKGLARKEGNRFILAA